jgi:predicted secreted Zn-dependent protease
MTTVTTKPAEKVEISQTERYDVMKKACTLTNVQLNAKVDIILAKIKDGTATDRERREAVIMSQVIINRGNAHR